MKDARRKAAPKVGEVWYARVQYGEGGGSKIRPVLIVGRSGDSYDAFASTTHPQPGRETMRPYDPEVAGLDGTSYILVDALVRIRESEFTRWLGYLCEDDLEPLEERYARLRKKK